MFFSMMFEIDCVFRLMFEFVGVEIIVGVVIEMDFSVGDDIFCVMIKLVREIGYCVVFVIFVCLKGNLNGGFWVF